MTGAADNSQEVLDVVDEENRVIGTATRGECHATGLLHRAVHCFVLNARGEVLLQRRSLSKKLGPGLWDMSAAEHVSSGESFKAAALRGLQEELGVVATADALEGPIGGTMRRGLQVGAVNDQEFVQVFVLRGFSGAVRVDPAEVHAVQYRTVREVLDEMQSQANGYTPWLCEHADLIHSHLTSRFDRPFTKWGKAVPTASP